MSKLLTTLFLVTATTIAAVFVAPVTSAQTQRAPSPAQVGPLFQSSAQCMTCHNGLTTAGGEDVSFGTSWHPSMMAHAARDPYWQAGVRREVTDHPQAQAAIENECSRCHMPMAHVETQRRGGQQSVFANIPSASPAAAIDPLAVEGVSCALCHQITNDGLGSKASFTGGFLIETTPPSQGRQMFGPYEVEPGPRSVMRSATGLQPTASTHIQRSEVCATCHTLYTHALNAGEATNEFPEQMPYQEWLHSEFRDSQSCQSCHMPVVTESIPIASVVGQPREAVSRHDFRGANFLMLGILNRYRAELGVVARPAEIDGAVMRTKAFLQSSSASLSVDGARFENGRLVADVVVRNLAGHKLPTAYPSRRSWLHVTVRDGEGRLVFSSGQVEPTGAIAGNDNDRDAARIEPHYREIRSGDEVQIYEAIMGTSTGLVTTGLLSAVSYLKDNRLPPRGFDKRTAPGDVAVHGDALADPDFGAGEDRVRYSVDTANARGPFTIEAELWYQSIGYRWARNLDGYKAAEPRRFVSYYDQAAPQSALLLTRTTRTVN